MIQWVEKQIFQESEGGPYRHSLWVPDFLARWDAWEYWEKDRFASMEANLCVGDVLLDVGAESGWQSAIYAKFVGAENMCLFEPAPEYWPNIRMIWEENKLAAPRATFLGFVADTSWDNPRICGAGWPDCSVGKLETRAGGYAPYRSLSNPGDYASGKITVDDFSLATGVSPNAITVDVEGAEILVLRGARHVLKRDRPLLWVSIHEPALVIYGSSKQEVFDMLGALGYASQYLGADHEEHWFFYPIERTIVAVDQPWGSVATRAKSWIDHTGGV